MKLTKEEARDIVYGNHPDYEIIKDNIVDQTRCDIVPEVVIFRKSRLKKL